MDLERLSEMLVTLGCPKEKAPDMASQLDKRAGQLAATKGSTYEEAMLHLLRLMQQGWAAKEKGI